MFLFTIETADYKKCKIDSDSAPACDEILLNKALALLYENRDKLEKSIDEYLNDDNSCLIFPFSLDKSKDLKKRNNEERHILKIDKIGNTYSFETFGLMGFISANFTDDDKESDTYHQEYHFNIFIHSRFDHYNTDKVIRIVKTGKTQTGTTIPCSKDYFLHYMLQRVLNINVLNPNPSAMKDSNLLELSLYFFPGMLRRALKQGLFKQYVYREYNDSRVRGPVDVSRHIVCNIPFCGKIAYSTHEYDYDNPVTQLVRHTIEYIRYHEWASELLAQCEDTRQDVQLIVDNTGRYNVNERRRIVDQNYRLLNHPFYTEWRPLQHLCLAILRHDDFRYDSTDDVDHIHGILFDGPWLWENYINKTLSCEKISTFIHCDNTLPENPVSIFKKKDKSKIDKSWYPDFYVKLDCKCDTKQKCASQIWDAKYKRCTRYDDEKKIYKFLPPKNEDLHQLLSYMWIMSNQSSPCQTVGLIYPLNEKECPPKQECMHQWGTMNGMGGDFYYWLLKISSAEFDSFDGFKSAMNNNEKSFIEQYKNQFERRMPQA